MLMKMRDVCFQTTFGSWVAGQGGIKPAAITCGVSYHAMRKWIAGQCIPTAINRHHIREASGRQITKRILAAHVRAVQRGNQV